jgi:hypothetical protein
MGVPEKPADAEQVRGKITVRRLGERFLAEYQRPTLASRDRYIRSARSKFKRRINPLFGSRPAASLTPDDVEGLRDALKAPPYDLAGASIVQRLALLSRVYNWGNKAKVIA